MMLVLLGVVALATILVSLARALAADAYGIRPPPRSHHDEVAFDPRGLPTKHFDLR